MSYHSSLSKDMSVYSLFDLSCSKPLVGGVGGSVALRRLESGAFVSKKNGEGAAAAKASLVHPVFQFAFTFLT